MKNAFSTGRKYYLYFKSKGYGVRCNHEDYENPYDPDNNDYEDFFDGWCWERDKFSST